MTARPRRRHGGQFPIVRGAVAVVAVLLVCSAAHLLGLLLVACLAGAGAYWAGWRHGQHSTGTAPAARPAAEARPRRGSRHLPPVRGGVVPVCAECAAGSCVWCNDSRCDHRVSGHPNLPSTRPLVPAGDEPPF